jgi:group I intron endonuclease
MKTGLIYKATSPSGKVYVGQTTQILEKRKKEHLKFSKITNTKLYIAMRKHGFENFKWEIIEDNIPEELLSIKECEWIQGLNSFICGYNGTIGGDKPNIFAPERNLKISIALKGKKKSEQHIKNNSLSHMGQPPWNKGIKSTKSRDKFGRFVS